MSDPKRATLITVGAPKSAKNNVNKTVRLTINLDESNESKYPELNYKELVIAEERKKRVVNGKTPGLDPFSDNDDDVERVAKKFEQKYGGKSTYGRKGRSKQDDFADIGAGYDENDSFIDNTHGYDEMIPPECDTFYGGFYINSGSLEFKTVANESGNSDEPNNASRRNKRRISSSSSASESSDSSSESESADEKDDKAVANGAIDSHKTEHRKKKNKKIDKKKANKVRRTDSSAATSGKQTSDDNGHGEGESADSRTSQSDSLTSKPAPSSENPITSDSSRDVETKVEPKLPQTAIQVLEALAASVTSQLQEHPNTPAKQMLANNEHHLLRLEHTLKKLSVDSCGSRAAWARAAAAFGALGVSRAKLLQRVKLALERKTEEGGKDATTSSTTIVQPTTGTTTVPTTNKNKRKHDEVDEADYSSLSDAEREANIVETLLRLKALIDERKPDMIASYNAECARVQEERKKLQIAKVAEGAPHIEKRLPKRRFPWCPRTRSLLARLTKLAGNQQLAANLLAKRALPLFPNGFVRMPTLLRQADLSKEIKVSELKRHRLGSASQPTPNHQASHTQANPQANPQSSHTPANPQTAHPQSNPQTQNTPFPDQIQFPSSLTVTTTMKPSQEKTETPTNTDDKFKSNPIFGSIINSFSLSKDLIVEKEKEKKDDKKEDLYIPPNNIGSITITAVPNQPKEKKSTVTVTDKQPGFIRVKSPAALNEMVNKKDVKVVKKQDKTPSNLKEKRVQSPLHIDTSYQSSKKDPSPKRKDEVTKKQIECMRVAEDKIPRPALVPVHHSPTFAKPDKRPPELKKKKDLIVVSDVDPLADNQVTEAIDNQETVAIDDSSSDVEVIEVDKSDKCEVPSQDKKCKSVPKERKGDEDASNDDINMLMRNIREMENSQETTKLNSNSFGGVITSAKHEMSSKGAFPRGSIFGPRDGEDKFVAFGSRPPSPLAERTSLNKMDGCNAITG